MHTAALVAAAVAAAGSLFVLLALPARAAAAPPAFGEPSRHEQPGRPPPALGAVARGDRARDAGAARRGRVRPADDGAGPAPRRRREGDDLPALGLEGGAGQGGDPVLQRHAPRARHGRAGTDYAAVAAAAVAIAEDRNAALLMPRLLTEVGHDAELHALFTAQLVEPRRSGGADDARARARPRRDPRRRGDRARDRHARRAGALPLHDRGRRPASRRGAGPAHPRAAARGPQST